MVFLSPSTRLRPWQILAATALLTGAALLAYWPALTGGFVWDDDTLVTDSALVKAPDGLYRMWFTTEPLDYWPLTNTSFWLEWRLWGMHSTGYHVTNLLLHRRERLAGLGHPPAAVDPGALLAAALFVLHPVNVESVAWIAQRKNTLSMVFFLLSILWYLRVDPEPEGALPAAGSASGKHERAGGPPPGEPGTTAGIGSVSPVRAGDAQQGLGGDTPRRAAADRVVAARHDRQGGCDPREPVLRRVGGLDAAEHLVPEAPDDGRHPRGHAGPAPARRWRDRLVLPVQGPRAGPAGVRLPAVGRARRRRPLVAAGVAATAIGRADLAASRPWCAGWSSPGRSSASRCCR